MSLPKQVQASLEEAERIEQELLNAATPPDTPPTEELPEPEPQPVEAQPEPAVEELQPVEQPAVDDTWERKYKTLQGMFNAETSRSRSEISDLKAQLNDAIRRMESAAAKPPEPAPILVTDKDVEDFGGDLVDLIKRQATDVARSEISRLEAENSQLREQLTGVSEVQGEQALRSYFADLSRLVPDYEEINVDDRFLGWLAEVDPLSGVARQEYLNNAFNSHDVARTATLFNKFRETIVPQTPATPTTNKLQRQVAPGTSKATPVASTSPAEKVWPMKEIEGFYRDVARGVYRGNDVEQARIEAEIDLAVLEGRLSN